MIIEVEERVELVILEDVVQKVSVLVAGLGQAVDVVKTVKHQTHSGVGYFVLSHLIAVVTTAENNGYDHHSSGSIFVPQWFTVKHCPLG